MQHAEIDDIVKGDFATITFDQPVEAIAARGERLRRRRQRMPIVGALSLAAIASTLALQGSSQREQAFAAWTSRAQATDPRTAATIDGNCRADGVPAALPLRVLDRRGDFSLSIYTDGQRLAVCDRFRGSDPERAFTQGGGGGTTAVLHGEAVTAQHPLAIEGAGSTFSAHEGSAAYAYGWVSALVSKVVISSGDYTTDATLSDGLFSGWWPGIGDKSIGAVVCTAYDASGEIVGQETLTEAARQPASPQR